MSSEQDQIVALTNEVKRLRKLLQEVKQALKDNGGNSILVLGITKALEKQ